MDISTFRWVLIIAGIAIVAGIFLFGNPDKKRKPRASRKRAHAQNVRQEPALDSDHSQNDDSDDDTDTRQQELAIDSGDDVAGRKRTEPQLEPAAETKPKGPPPPMPDKIVTLFLQARDNHIITGIELLDASLKSGLVFGAHDIFH